MHCHQVLGTASLCSACVETQEHIRTSGCVLISKAKPPAGGHCLQGLAGGSFGVLPFAAHRVHLSTSICCWLPLVLQLASLTASWGCALPPSSFLSPVVSACGLAWLLFLLWSTDVMPRSLCISVRFPSSVAFQLVLNFWPLLWFTSSLLSGWLFLSLIFCITEGWRVTTFISMV